MIRASGRKELKGLKKFCVMKIMLLSKSILSIWILEIELESFLVTFSISIGTTAQQMIHWQVGASFLNTLSVCGLLHIQGLPRLHVASPKVVREALVPGGCYVPIHIHILPYIQTNVPEALLWASWGIEIQSYIAYSPIRHCPPPSKDIYFKQASLVLQEETSRL